MIDSTNKHEKKDNTNIEYLVNLDVMTSNGLRCIMEEKTGMLSRMFYDCVRPQLNPKSIAQNFSTNWPD